MGGLTNVEIQKYDRHRYPYLLIDKVNEITPGEYVKGHKQFTLDEWIFHCRKGNEQSVPFTLLIEILTEIFLIPILVLDGNEGKIINFLSAEDVKVEGGVYPGDCMVVEAYVESWRHGIAKGKAVGYVNNKKICSAKLKFAVVDEMEKFKPVNKVSRGKWDENDG